jgi:DnaJ homolog subfamily C member 9
MAIDASVGSAEEIEDLKTAYLETKGSIGDIINHIPHSTHDDEARFVIIITGLISKGELKSLPAWKTSVKDEKARLARKKQGDKEAKEAEQLAKELGVWDEFFGSGKVGERKGKGKGNKKAANEDGEEDHSALQALILSRKQKNMDDLIDNLAAKYGAVESDKSKGKGKRRASGQSAEAESPKKRAKGDPEPPDIDDEEFEKLQQKLFSDKARPQVQGGKKAGRTKTRK